MTKNQDQFDIAIIAEGSYPFVQGGVSTWIHQIVTALSELNFGIIFLGSRPDDYHGMKYELPDNVVYFSTNYLFGEKSSPPITKKTKLSSSETKRITSMHSWFKRLSFAERGAQKDKLVDVFHEGIKTSHQQFLYSKESWAIITKMYEMFCDDPSFIDYFWTTRSLHHPLFTIKNIADSFPKAKLIHTISTGYAGFLASLSHLQHNIPVVLTEHGIYTKERRIELLRQSFDVMENVADLSKTYSQRLWINFFETLSHITYEVSSPIISLYQRAREKQIEEGAPDNKNTYIVPNGVNLKKFAPLRREKPSPIPKVLCLIGRIAPIKDIKTFIRAISLLRLSLPDIQGWIVGPSEEDPEYKNECTELAESLHISNQVIFKGSQDITTILPQVGIMVLTSISEGQPLVTLESFAAGIPMIATDVGSCRELIEGSTKEDQDLGHAGKIIRIGDHEGLSREAEHLLTNPDDWYAAQKVAIARAEKYYDQDQLFKTYREIYKSKINEEN